MSAALKAATPPPAKLSPEREALAAAIKAVADVDADSNAAFRAMRDLDNQVAGARRVLEDAQEKMATAQAAHATHLADTAMGKTLPPPLSLKEARAAVLEAEDNITALKEAQSALSQRVRDLREKQSLPFTRMALDAAIAAVIKSEVNAEALCTDIQKLQDELIEKRLVYCFLRGLRAGIVNDEMNKRWALPAVDCPVPGYQDPAWSRPPPAWHSAYSELRLDAATRLPKV